MVKLAALAPGAALTAQIATMMKLAATDPKRLIIEVSNEEWIHDPTPDHSAARDPLGGTCDHLAIFGVKQGTGR